MFFQAQSLLHILPWMDYAKDEEAVFMMIIYSSKINAFISIKKIYSQSAKLYTLGKHCLVCCIIFYRYCLATKLSHTANEVHCSHSNISTDIRTQRSQIFILAMHGRPLRFQSFNIRQYHKSQACITRKGIQNPSCAGKSSSNLQKLAEFLYQAQ